MQSPAFFEETDGLAALVQSSTEQLIRDLEKCPTANIEQTSNTGLNSVLVCAEIREQLPAVIEAKAEPRPVYLNTNLIATLSVMDRMFPLANAEGKFGEINCPTIPGAREIKTIFGTPIMRSAAKSAEGFETPCEDYAPHCAVLD